MASRLAALAASSGLLPATADDFSSPKFWQQFFERRGGNTFEWYGTWPEFARNLERAWGARPREAARTLVVGCGNSELSQQLYSAGWKSQTSIDIDAGVIAEMQRKTGQRFPGMSFQAMDARDLSALGTASFDLVVDKGTLDAMCTNDSAAVRENVRRMLREVSRVIAPGGVYAVVTLLQRHVLRELLWLGAAAERPTSGGDGGGRVWASMRLEAFDDADGSSPLCPFVAVLRAAVDEESSPNDAFPVTLLLPPLLRPGPSSAENRRQWPGEEVGFALQPLGSDAFDGAPAAAGGEDASDDFAAEDAKAVLHGVVQAQVLYSTALQLSRIAKGQRVEIDVWATPAIDDSASAQSGSAGMGSGSAGIGSGKRAPRAAAPPPGAGERRGAVYLTLAGAPAPPQLTQQGPASTTVRPRFSITVVDAGPTVRAGVLLVPQGREHEWSFGAADGQEQLVTSSGFGRLLFVAMGRGHSFPGGQAAVQAELSAIVTQLLPPSLRTSRDVPFLAVADDIGSRELVAEGVSALSGAWVVEDVPWSADMDDEDEGGAGGGGAAEAGGGGADESDLTAAAPKAHAARSAKAKGKKKNKKGKVQEAVCSSGTTASDAAPSAPAAVRRLVFMSNRNAVQSAVRLLQRRSGGPLHHDFAWLDFDYHKGMVSAVVQQVKQLGATPVEPLPAVRCRVLVIGLGGGVLPMFLACQLPQVDVIVVELDQAVVDIAAKHFGLCVARGGPLAADDPAALLLGSKQPPGDVSVVVGDGIAYVQHLATAAAAALATDGSSESLAASLLPLPDVVLIDTDAKDISGGLSFPPPAFLSQRFLEDLSAILRPRRGIAVFNVAARSRDLFDAAVSSIRNGFGGGSGRSLEVAGSAVAPPSHAHADIICASIGEADLNSLVVVRSPAAPRSPPRPVAAGSPAQDAPSHESLALAALTGTGITSGKVAEPGTHALPLPVQRCWNRWAPLMTAAGAGGAPGPGLDHHGAQ